MPEEVRPGIYRAPSDPTAWFVNVYPDVIDARTWTPTVVRLPREGWAKAKPSYADMFATLPADAEWSPEPVGAARGRLFGRAVQLRQQADAPNGGRYTAAGPVRGECGHRHRTWAAAERCAARDDRACRRQGIYSDRVVEVRP